MISRRFFLAAAPAFIAATRLDFGVPKKLITPTTPILSRGMSCPHRPALGDLWFDTIERQLLIWCGDGWYHA